MALLPAYAVNEGMVPAEMLRRALWASTRGESGVVTAHDLKVTALPTPGAGVRVAAGGAVCAMRTTGSNAQESYMLAQDATANVALDDEGTFYLIARIDDWHFTGNPAPADPLNAIYWAFATVSTLSGITYPYVPLAKLTIPASTSTITNAMITDIRNVANPRKDRQLFAYDLGPTDTLATQESWPDVGGFDVYIPEWATQAHIIATFSQVLIPAGSTRTGFLWANLKNGVGGPTVRYLAPGLPNAHRSSYVAVGDMVVPPELRGTNVYSYTVGNVTGGTGGFLTIDGNSAVSFDIEFHETPV